MKKEVLVTTKNNDILFLLNIDFDYFYRFSINFNPQTYSKILQQLNDENKDYFDFKFTLSSFFLFEYFIFNFDDNILECKNLQIEDIEKELNKLQQFCDKYNLNLS